MKELNIAEMNEISGAGIFSDAGAALGEGIGAVVDASKGLEGTAARAGASLGSGIGAVIDGGVDFFSGFLNNR
ncbi:hypothetical protein ABN154_30690 [Klebsiella michiganensis]|uniref:Bacteriocin n=1 Tax=Klebsiella michiganensis TaxID=1134687 RepID=A0A6P1V6W4_9ENTR|nr:hypothetical protein [Klebsiella michiganensis]QHS50234.1 hypothetical protein GW952_32115 [Klebsiella michiganensis]HDX8941042.1 hypothetical protein [Klebsiella michiganensis]